MSETLGPNPLTTVAKLMGVHPGLVRVVIRILAAMEARGAPMMVTDGVRSLEQQQALYQQGRTKPGRIVTYADGVKNRSNHQVKDDGWGHAVDMAFLVSGKPSWDEHLPWSAYGSVAKAQGALWGGDWAMPKTDRPHIELP